MHASEASAVEVYVALALRYNELFLTVSKLPALMRPGIEGAVPRNGAAAVDAACSSNAVVANAALIATQSCSPDPEISGSPNLSRYKPLPR